MTITTKDLGGPEAHTGVARSMKRGTARLIEKERQRIRNELRAELEEEMVDADYEVIESTQPVKKEKERKSTLKRKK